MNRYAHISEVRQLLCGMLRLSLGMFVCVTLYQSVPLYADIELEQAQAEKAAKEAQQRIGENLYQQDAESERLGELREQAYEQSRQRRQEIPAQPTRPHTPVTTLLIPERTEASESAAAAIPAGTSDDAITEVASRQVPVLSTTPAKERSARIQDFSGRKSPSDAWQANRTIKQYVREFKTHN